jgi:hypothetical protein
MFDERRTGSNYLSKLTLSRNRMPAGMTDWRLQLHSVLDTKGIYLTRVYGSAIGNYDLLKSLNIVRVIELQFTLVTQYCLGK